MASAALSIQNKEYPTEAGVTYMLYSIQYMTFWILFFKGALIFSPQKGSLLCFFLSFMYILVAIA